MNDAVTLSITTLGKMPLIKMSFSVMLLNIMTLSKMPLGKMLLSVIPLCINDTA